MDEPYTIADLADMGLVEDSDGEWTAEATESLDDSLPCGLEI